MQVGFTDPQGPKRWRMLPYLAALFVFSLGAFVPFIEAPFSTALVLLAFTLFNVVGLFQPRQQTARNAELVLGPGFVEVKQAGSRNQKIRAKDITGGTSARTKQGTFAFTVQLKNRDQPVTIELRNEEELIRLRHALGVGHGGFGTVAWTSQVDSNARTAATGRVMGSIGFGVMTLLQLLMSDHQAANGLCGFIGMFAGIGMLLGLVGLFSRASDPTVVMAWDGLKLKSVRGWFALPYGMLANLEDHKRGLIFHLPPPHPPVGVEKSPAVIGGLSLQDRQTLIAQITSAAQRARGLGPQKDDVRGRVDQLRRNGESPRDWLTRLDMAGQMLAAGSGYRGNTLDAEDLWAILEDPEAEPELRAAAARVLRHSTVPEARVRIEAAVAAVRDEATNKRLRIAVRDDLDGASQELAFLDASDRIDANPAMRQQFYPPPFR
ncbi:MAG: hypothetical protein U0270_42440 [Labilithrix sp.]